MQPPSLLGQPRAETLRRREATWVASRQESPASALCPNALPKSPACCRVTAQHCGQQPGSRGLQLRGALQPQTHCTPHSGCTLLSPAACCCHLLRTAAMPGAPSRALPVLGCGSVPSRGCAAVQKGRPRERLRTSTCTVTTINSMKDCAEKSSPDAAVAKL